MLHIMLLVMEKMQFNHFPIVSLWELSVAIATKNQEADHHNFSYFELPLPKQHLNQIRIILLQWFRRNCHLKKSFFFNLMLPWQPNKMATGHKTNQLGRQSSNDHKCQIWFTSLHRLRRKYNLTIFRL